MPNPSKNYPRNYSFKQIQKAEKYSREGKCDEAALLLKDASEKYSESYAYFTALGNLQNCKKLNQEAKLSWQKALDLEPAYLREKRELEGKVKQ